MNKKQTKKIENESQEEQSSSEFKAHSSQLEGSELEFLQKLQFEIESTYEMATQVEKDAANAHPSIERAQKIHNTVENVLEVLNDDQASSQMEEDVKFAIDNTLLEYATSSRRLLDEKEQLRKLVKQRNDQIRNLVLRVKQMESQMKVKDEYIQRMELQLNVQSKNINNFQNKYEEEHRARIVQETLRQPRDKQTVAQQKIFQSQNLPLYVTATDTNIYKDGNIRQDPFDFWKSENQNQNQMISYPGQPKRLHDLVNPNTIWVGKEQKQNEIQTKNFQYQSIFAQQPYQSKIKKEDAGIWP